MVKIVAVASDSYAARLGFQAGDYLVSLNGKSVEDFLDYHFLQADENLDIIIRRGEKELQFQVSKTYDQDLGLELESPQLRACGNNCIFCFIKQNPPGMRPAIYFHDEDYRYSFLHGTYITLTNLRESDLQRIVQMRLSPLYVSIHATAEAVRRQIFGLKRPDHLLEKLEFLTSRRIDLHAQIVLLPGVNDGEVLEQTLRELYQFREHLVSIAIVPVGLTRHRQNLPTIRAVGPHEARQCLSALSHWHRQYRNRDGERWVYLSDEFYLLAGKPLPARRFYGSFYQIENGVGLTRQFLDDFRRQARCFPAKIAQPYRVLFVTGALATPILKSEVLPIIQRIANFHVDICQVVNNFFGESVTVAGLLVGRDMIEQVKQPKNYDLIVLPPRCVNSASLLLDDITPAELSRVWNTPVVVFDGNFSNIIVGKNG